MHLHRRMCTHAHTHEHTCVCTSHTWTHMYKYTTATTPITAMCTVMAVLLIYFLNSSCSIHYHHLFVYMCSICFLCLNVTFTNIRVLFALCIVTSQATSPVPSTLQALTKNCCMLNEPSKISLILNRFWKQKSSPLIKQKNKNRKGLFERKD